MNWIEKYIAYAKDNPKGYWFKRKIYGWGWVPVRRQGWLVTAVFLVAILFFAFTIDENSPPNELMFTFFLPITLLVISLIRICYWKGEPPKWQWGFPKDKDTSQK